MRWLPSKNTSSGGSATELDYEDLLNFANELGEEERHIREGLTEAELELFDLMKKEKLTKAQEKALKNAARMLLKRLKSLSKNKLNNVMCHAV
jgi:type I restriction enzyme, R subunit